MSRRDFKNLILDYEYNPEDKEKNTKYNMMYFLNRTRRMFKWNGLPDTIPERSLELMLQRTGHVCFAKVNGDLYAFHGSLGGMPDAYYMPTKYIVANPYLNLSKTYDIGKDCVVMPNDTMYVGLLPIIQKYCYLIAENELTMYDVDIMVRSALVFKADSEREMKSAQAYVDGLKDGKLGIILSDKFLGTDGVEVQLGATTATQSITHLIELHQYLKSALFNELGVQSNWNAKRESITSSETLLNMDSLFPLVDDMFEMRKLFAEEVNKMFGTSISVERDSSWEYSEETRDIELDNLENEIPDNNNNVEESEDEADDTEKQD